jgi:hypothetical protein
MPLAEILEEGAAEFQREMPFPSTLCYVLFTRDITITVCNQHSTNDYHWRSSSNLELAIESQPN